MPKYKKLDIDFCIPDTVEKEIDRYVNHINFEDGNNEDWYRMEIDLALKEAYDTKGIISRKQFDLLRDYYVFKGILKNG